VWVNVPGGKRGLGQTSRRRGRLLDTGNHHHPIDLLRRALTTHFEVGWLDRELVVPLAGHPLLVCEDAREGGAIVAGTKSVGAGPRLPSFFLSRRPSQSVGMHNLKTEIFSGAHKMLQLLHRLSYRQIPNHSHNNTSPIVS